MLLSNKIVSSRFLLRNIYVTRAQQLSRKEIKGKSSNSFSINLLDNR